MLAAIDLNYSQIYNLAMQMNPNDRKRLAEDLFVSCSNDKSTETLIPYTLSELNARLDEAEADVREGRIISAEEGHRMLEEKFPYIYN